MNAGVWNFMSDALTDGRKVRVFNVIDDCNREALAIKVRLSYPARALVETLECLKEEIDTPKYVRCDNGPKFISKTFMNLCKKNFIEFKFFIKSRINNNYLSNFKVS